MVRICSDVQLWDFDCLCNLKCLGCDRFGSFFIIFWHWHHTTGQPVATIHQRRHQDSLLLHVWCHVGNVRWIVCFGWAPMGNRIGVSAQEEHPGKTLQTPTMERERERISRVIYLLQAWWQSREARLKHEAPCLQLSCTLNSLGNFGMSPKSFTRPHIFLRECHDHLVSLLCSCAGSTGFRCSSVRGWRGKFTQLHRLASVHPPFHLIIIYVWDCLGWFCKCFRRLTPRILKTWPCARCQIAWGCLRWLFSDSCKVFQINGPTTTWQVDV